jgi:acyl-CoA hydrolase
VEGDYRPLWKEPAPPPTETDIQIARHIFPHICDGATVQLGIGGTPNALGELIADSDLKDLGMHTELCSDGYLAMHQAGKLTNRRKTLHPGKGVLGIVIGSRELYEWVDDNPGIAGYPLSYVNDPAVIAQNDNMISINAALEVDLFGQVCAESIGTKIMSGSGGQVDYVRGACQSKGGKSFIAFTSTAKGGTISKIKPILTPGAVVTTSKNDVDYIVTEYGLAHLRGEPLSSRVRQLIAIAHPDFRDELRFEAKKRGILI